MFGHRDDVFETANVIRKTTCDDPSAYVVSSLHKNKCFETESGGVGEVRFRNDMDCVGGFWSSFQWRFVAGATGSERVFRFRSRAVGSLRAQWELVAAVWLRHTSCGAVRPASRVPQRAPRARRLFRTRAGCRCWRTSSTFEQFEFFHKAAAILTVRGRKAL
jgi:hypothetical protein